MYYFNNGERYEGKWKNGMKDGQGTLHMQHNEQYDGHWEKDMKHGFGMYKFSNGD